MKKLFLSLIIALCGSAPLFALSVNSTVPAKGAKNVAVSSKIVYVFSESIALGSGNCTLNGTAITPTAAGKYLIFTPNFSYFTDYTLIIPAGAVKSTSGTAFAGDTLSFTTAPTPMPGGCNTDVSAIGAGAYSSIQAAIDAAPSNGAGRYVIYVREGDYNESINIPANKKNITLWGEHLSHTVLHQATSAPSLHIQGEGCYVFNMTIRNLSSDSTATAVKVDADKAMLRYCEIAGGQKSLDINTYRGYFYQCFIEGASPVINSRGTAYFDYCQLKTSTAGAMVTAATFSTAAGMVFYNTQLLSTTSDLTVGKALNASAAISYQQSIFPSAVSDQLWDRNGQSYARLTEYMNFGPGAKSIDGINYLPSSEIDHYSALNVLAANVLTPETSDTWDPFETLTKTGKKADTWLEGDGLGANRGGNGGKTVTVSTMSELNTYATSADPYIIQVKGIINFSGSAVLIASNKTITGIDESSTIVGNLQINEGVSNVIIKYLNITHPGELKVNDGISMEGAHRVLVHHVSFYDCSDGCCDMRNSTDSVTFSWNQLYYVEQINGHRFTMIADGTLVRDNDGNVVSFLDPLQITFHHNWWSTLCHERMPSSTNTHAHLYNCYWSCSGNYYCSLARDNSRFYSENNYYKGVQNPLYKGNFTTCLIYSSGNTFSSCTGTQYKTKDAVTAPDYKYLIGTTKDVPGIVSARAGNVRIDTNYLPTALKQTLSDETSAPALVASTDTGFNIWLPNLSDKTSVLIYDLQGSLLYQHHFSHQQQIEISLPLSKGVYLLKIDSDTDSFSKVVARR